MELWNEYEGRTIDGLFPLTKLLEPEGRSAFFSTSNGSGIPTVIRLIESHFDDAEILARWKKVAALNQSNLVTLKKFGQVELDGTSLVYAVMEPAEANLGEILRERRLTVTETKQLAASLVAALETLHTSGLVHEHVEPGNVLAIGETIKLRSDCVREAPEGEEGRELKRKDVHDLALVLLRALTQQRTLEAASNQLPLPDLFDQIVRKGISGEWGLREIAALVPPAPIVAAAVPTASVKAVVATPTVPSAAAAAEPRGVRPVVHETAGRPLISVAPMERPVVSQASAKARERVGYDREEEPRGLTPRKISYGVGVILVLLLVWLFARGRSSEPKGAAENNAAPVAAVQRDAGSSASSAKDAVGTKAAADNSAPVVADASAALNQTAMGDVTEQWRVIAYTYNHESQAKEKAGEITGKHPDLKPEVFTVNGRAPYLVSVGGAMSRDQAFAFVRRARSEGMPRDAYAQNYGRKGRR
jgi:eukaryotic-like serine/threonine-protein kinase